MMRRSMRFHLLVPGGKWHTETGPVQARRPGAAARASTAGCGSSWSRVAYGQASRPYEAAPPPPERLDRERNGVVIHADAGTAGVFADVANSSGNRLAKLGIRKVVHVCPRHVTCAVPLAPAVSIVSDELLFLGID